MSTLQLTHGSAKETSCTVHLFGATVTSWRVHGLENLFVSSKAKLDGTKAIRGGIPVCFPAFGPWALGPQHGFARNSSKWRPLEDVNVINDKGDVRLRLVLDDGEIFWKDVDFELVYSITLTSRTLDLDVLVRNKAEKEPLKFTFALHTYYNVADVTECKIDGLKGVTFTDKTRDGEKSVEGREVVAVKEFTDRVYAKAADVITLKGLGPGGKRGVRLSKSGLADWVVWNPWAENAAKMSDFGDGDEFKRMICVEAAQTSTEVVVEAGGEWRCAHNIAVMD